MMITYPSTHGVFEEKVKELGKHYIVMAVSFTWMALILMPW